MLKSVVLFLNIWYWCEWLHWKYWVVSYALDSNFPLAIVFFERKKRISPVASKWGKHRLGLNKFRALSFESESPVTLLSFSEIKFSSSGSLSNISNNQIIINKYKKFNHWI